MSQESVKNLAAAVILTSSDRTGSAACSRKLHIVATVNSHALQGGVQGFGERPVAGIEEMGPLAASIHDIGPTHLAIEINHQHRAARPTPGEGAPVRSAADASQC